MYLSTKHYSNALWSIVLLAIGMLWLTTAMALAPAGYAIKNRATVTYQDSLGNEYTTMSNESVVTVAELYGAELESNRSTKAAPGQTVYFSHQLISLGNTDDRFSLTVSNKNGSALSSLKVYLDSNGDGQPTTGEPEIRDGQEIAVGAGGTINLVVAGLVPAAAKVSDEFLLEVKATPSNRPASALSTDAKLVNTDTVSVTDGPVLQVNTRVISYQSATVNSLGSITYRVQVINNGTDLNGGGIYNFFPDFIQLADLNGQETADTQLGKIEIKSSSTLKRELPKDSALIPENNNDNGLYVGITSLPSGKIVYLDFTVRYPLVAGDLLGFSGDEVIKVRTWVGYEKTEGDLWSLASESNLAKVKLPQFYAVKVSNKDNSGNEEVLPSAPAGGVAEFINTITNLGNGKDAFNLKVTNINFPEGTEFTLWDETGRFALPDFNGDGQVDTGPLPSPLTGTDNQIKVMVKARIPGKIPTVAGPFMANLEAISTGDSSIKGTVTEILNGITSGDIDLANYQATTKNIVFNGQVTDITDFFKADASADYDPVNRVTSVISRRLGESAEFGLYIANLSDISDSFSLSFKLSDPSLRWQVTYRNQGIFDKDGNILSPASGELITSTPQLPAKTVMKVLATVELVGDIDQVLANTYDIDFTISARSSGKTNSTRDAVKLLAKSMLIFTPDTAEGQVAAGDFIEYKHTLVNTGNTVLDVAITTMEGTVLPSGWSYLVKIGSVILDTNDKSADFYKLEPGVEQVLTVKISAEGTLPAGSILNLPLIAIGMLPDTSEMVTSAQIIDTTRVLSAFEARITTNKTVAVVISDGNYGNFAETLPSPVAPGKRVVWKVIAANASEGVAENVIIYDQAPAFTRFVPASSGAGIPGNPKIGTTPATASQVKVDGDKITFYVGDGADSGKAENPGGSLAAGSTIEVTFEVEVE